MEKQNNKIVVNNRLNQGNSPQVLNMAISTFLVEKEKYVLNPPYQRGYVWNYKRQQKLIESVLSGWPINTIHLSQSDDEYHVIDGKQRITTLLNFICPEKDQTAVKVFVDKGNGEISKMSYATINKEAIAGNIACQSIKNKISNYALSIVRHENMNMSKEKDLFDRINESEPLGVNEKIFCSNFRSTSIFKYIFNKHVKKLNYLLTNNITVDRNYTGMRFLAEILVLGFGKDLSENFDCRNKNTSDIQKFINFFENKIDNIQVEGMTDEEVQECISDMFYLDKKYKLSSIDKEFEKSCDKIVDALIGVDNIKILKICIDGFLTIFNRQKNLKTKGKKDKAWFLDCFCWAIGKYQDKILTKSYVEANWLTMHDLFVNQYKIGWRDTEEGQALKTRNNEGSRIRTRINVLEKMFQDSGLDTGKKNQNLSAKDKFDAILQSDGTCQYTGKLLSDPHIDHFKPKSLYSEHEKAVVSDPFYNISVGNKPKNSESV